MMISAETLAKTCGDYEARIDALRQSLAEAVEERNMFQRQAVEQGKRREALEDELQQTNVYRDHHANRAERAESQLLSSAARERELREALEAYVREDCCSDFSDYWNAQHRTIAKLDEPPKCGKCDWCVGKAALASLKPVAGTTEKTDALG